MSPFNRTIPAMALLASTFFGSGGVGAGDFSLTHGHVYTSSERANSIIQARPDGTVVGTLSLSGYGSTRGMAFGPDDTLFVVAVAPHGYDVIRIDTDGQVLATYPGPTYIQGNISYGKIAVSTTGRVYVAGQSHLQSFVPGVSGTEPIFTSSGVFDVDILPSGNLLVLAGDGVYELTPTGGLVRQVPLVGSLVDARGLKYDAESGHLYTTMLGYTGHFHEIRKWDFDTGFLEDWAYYTYADDIDQFWNGRLVFGSRTSPPAIFDEGLALMSVLGAEERMFVAVFEQDAMFRSDFED